MQNIISPPELRELLDELQQEFEALDLSNPEDYRYSHELFAQIRQVHAEIQGVVRGGNTYED